jgi:regulator of sigma E protease
MIDLATVFSFLDVFINRWVSPILVIGVLVFIHELGHFLVAKWCGVGVVKFSVGFGPAIFRFRRGETVYQLSIIPLGGFVRMVGDMPDMLTGEQVTDSSVRSSTEQDESSEQGKQDLSQALGVEVTPELQKCLDDKSKWFIEKNYWQKSAIVFAGPFFNFVLSFVLIFLSAWAYGQYEPVEQAVIGEVIKGSPAEASGLRGDDQVLSVNGSSVSSWIELAETIHASDGSQLSLEIKRGEATIPIEVIPVEKDIRYGDGTSKKAKVIGISGKLNIVEISLGEAVKTATQWTINTTMLTYKGLWGMISGEVSPKDLAGPIFILQAAGEQAEKGFDRLINLTAILSISLAVLNLLPIPVLDGGHLLFFLIEALLGPISIRKKEIAQSVGMLFLLCLMGFAIRNDLVRDTSGFSQRESLEFEEDSSTSSSAAPSIDSSSEQGLEPFPASN